MTEKVPFMLLPTGITKALAKLFVGTGEHLKKLFPNVEESLKEINLDFYPSEYMAAVVVNAGFIGGLMFGLIFFLMYMQQKPINQAIGLAFAVGFGLFFLFFMILVKYPSILSGKRAEMIDRTLIFALKDMLLQVGSGVALYNSLVNVAEANYGEVSLEFHKIIKDINGGMPMIKALEKAAIGTKSEYFKRTVWQLVNGIKAGSNLKGILKTIIRDLTSEQRTKIRNYARELNLWSLLYMLFAVAVPSIGTTLLVILTSFAGFGITKGMFIGFIVLCFFIQYALMGFVKSRRPTTDF